MRQLRNRPTDATKEAARELCPGPVHRHLARRCAEADFIRGSILIVVSWCHLRVRCRNTTPTA